MKCPYCNCEMREGYIDNIGEAVCWTPEGESKGWTRWSAHPDGVKLAKLPVFGRAKARAHYCQPCHKVIIDTWENER